MKKLVINFLYLDLSVCERCQATDKVLDEALDDLRQEIKSVKELTINKIKITSDEEAQNYNFIRSPTIRLNGVDIEEILTGKLEIKDNYCDSCVKGCADSCSAVTGGGTQCRIVEYEGKTYEAVPKEMIKDAITKVGGMKMKKESAQLIVESSSIKSCDTSKCDCG